ADGGRGLHAGHEAEPDPERQLLRLCRDRALSATGMMDNMLGRSILVEEHGRMLILIRRCRGLSDVPRQQRISTPGCEHVRCLNTFSDLLWSLAFHSQFASQFVIRHHGARTVAS